MTNAEKFKEVFGMRHDSHIFRKGKRDTKLINTQTFWESEFKEPKEDTTFTFGNKNKVALLISLDENIYKTINHGFLDTFEIRDVREAIINGKKVIGEAENNDAKWEEAIEKIKADINDGINETASLIEVAKVNTNFFAEEELGRLKNILNNVQEIIDKHTKELMK